MPNHCQNILRVQGTPEGLAAFKEKARAGESPLTFGAFVPVPDTVIQGVGHGTFVRQGQGEWCDVARTATAMNLKAPEGNWSEQHAWLCNRLAEAGFEIRTIRFVQHDNGVIEELPENAVSWYEWRSEHWGTKWDAYDFDDTPEENPSSGLWELSFYTAWAPPAPVIYAMQQQHPELRIELRFSEPGNGLLGAIRPDGTSEFREVEFLEVGEGQEDVDPYFEAVHDFLYD